MLLIFVLELRSCLRVVASSHERHVFASLFIVLLAAATSGVSQLYIVKGSQSLAC